MGDVSDSMIDGQFDYITGEYLGSPVGYPRTKWDKPTYSKRTPSEKKIASIRKEIAIDIKSGTPVDEARRKANIKYGKGWRERGLCVNDDDQWTEEDLKPFK